MFNVKTDLIMFLSMFLIDFSFEKMTSLNTLKEVLKNLKKIIVIQNRNNPTNDHRTVLVNISIEKLRKSKV